MQNMWFLILIVYQSHGFILEHLDKDFKTTYPTANQHFQNSRHQIQFGEGNLQFEQLSSPHAGESIRRESETYRIDHTIIVREEDDTNVIERRHHSHGNIHVKIKALFEKYANRFNKNNNSRHGDTNIPEINISGDQTAHLTRQIERINGSSRIEHSVRVYENNDYKTYPIKAPDSRPKDNTRQHSHHKHNKVSKTTTHDPDITHTEAERDESIGGHQSLQNFVDTSKTNDESVPLYHPNKNRDTNLTHGISSSFKNSTACIECPYYVVRDRHGKKKEVAIEGLSSSTDKETVIHKSEMVKETAHNRHPDHKKKHFRSDRKHHHTSNRHNKHFLDSSSSPEKHVPKAGDQLVRGTQRPDNKNKQSTIQGHHYATNTIQYKPQSDNIYGRNISKQHGAQTVHIAQSKHKDNLLISEVGITDSSSSNTAYTCLLPFFPSLVFILNIWAIL